MLVILLVSVTAVGCSRPKPAAKETPLPSAEVLETTATPELLPTGVGGSPTVVTTHPTGEAAAPSVVSGAEGGTAPTPTPVVIALTPAPTPAATIPPAAEPTTTTGEGWILYMVQSGDTLYSLAARYGTTVEAIMALNPTLSTPEQLQAGTQIKLPQGEAGTTPIAGGGVEYIVQAGDDLGLIASKFGVSMDDIVRANGLENPDFIYVGQKLIIPTEGGTSAPPSGKVHVVRPGETLLMIAEMYGTTPEALAQANGLVNPNWIYVGQTLQIP